MEGLGGRCGIRVDSNSILLFEENEDDEDE